MSYLGWLAWCVGATAVAALPASALGQATERLTEGCSGCHIRIDTVAILGDRDGPGMIEDDFTPTSVDSHGHFYLLSGGGVQVKVFDPEGAYLRSIGKRGDGPGEFQLVRRLFVDANDHLYAPDRIHGRITVLTPLGNVVRTITVGPPWLGFNIYPLRGDSLLVGGHSLSPELVGLPAHIISPEGALVRSFGERTYPVEATTDEFLLHRAIALSEDHTFWVAGWDRYHIELWRTDGQRLRHLVREPAWFSQPAALTDGRVPPRPALLSIFQDADGFLWTSSTVASSSWTDGPHAIDTIVEVIDPASTQVLASTILPGRYTDFFGDRLASTNLVDLENHTVRSIVLQFHLERP
jgi:hypothetical protein